FCDSQAFQIECFNQTANGGSDVFSLPPHLCLFHAGQVEKRDCEVVLRVKVGKRDGKEAVTADKTVAKKLSAKILSSIGHRSWQCRKIDLLPDGIDGNAGVIFVLTPRQKRRTPHSNRQLYVALG